MNKKKKFFTIIDLGNYKLRLAVIDNNNETLFSLNELVKNNNSQDEINSLTSLIKTAEKKLSNHIDEVILLFDSNNICSIDLSLKDEINLKENLEKIYSSLLLEAKKLIEYNHPNYKILNSIISEYLLDGKVMETLPKNKNDFREIILNFKFICIPNENYIKIKNLFVENNIIIKNIFCSSYIKSLNYLKKLNTGDIIYFLDIGYERTTLNVFKSNKLYHINSIPVGGNHITKDISSLLKIDHDKSEELKKLFNRSEEEFSFNGEKTSESKISANDLFKKVPIDILKKIILARVQEIIDLSFKTVFSSKDFPKDKLSNLILVGDGSKIFDKNSFYFDKTFEFSEINFFEESDSEICQFAYNFYLDNEKLQSKVDKKLGLFSKFFRLFQIN